MGKKYIINAFNYPYAGVETQYQTNCWFTAIICFMFYSIKYDGVDIAKRR